MSCHRAAELDLAAYRADPGAPGWDAFREHAPRCADCSRALAAWLRLEGAMADAADANAAHPGDAALLAYASEPAELGAARRAAIAAHLDGCAPCRTELSVLRRFDFAALAAPAVARSTAPSEPPAWERLRAFLAERVGPLPRPALAMAATIALAVPAGVLVWAVLRGPGVPESAPALAQRAPASPTAAPSLSVPAPTDPARDPAPEVIASAEPPESAGRAPADPPASAERAPADPAESAGPAAEPPEPARAPDAAPREIAGTSPGRFGPGPAPPPAPRPDPAAAGSADLAALLPEAPPRYQPRLRLAGGSFASLRPDTAIRAAGGGLPTLRALVPEHLAASGTASPTLYWLLDAPSDVPVELTLIAEDGVTPLFERRLAPPVRAGVHALALAGHGVVLPPGVSVRWFAALVPDADRRDLDAVSGGAVHFVPLPDELAARLEATPPAGRAALLAEAGYWIDAFDALTRIADASRDPARADAHRAALLDQVKLPEAARALRQADAN